MNKALTFFSRLNFQKLSPVMLSLWAILLLELGYIFLVLANYFFSWMHIEVYPMNSWVLSNGHDWRWEDFVRSLNTDILEGPGAGGEDRISRPISNFVDLINVKFRTWCWNYVPPHPAFSIWWPASFIILPVFLYKFFKNMKCDQCVSFGGVILYLSSIGFLVPNIMYFRSSKNLINIFAVLILYLGSRLYREAVSLSPGGSIKDIPRFRRQFFIFLLTMFLGFFADETGVFIYVMAAVLLYPVLCRPRERSWLWTAYLTLPFLYGFMLLKGLPFLHVVATGKVRDLSRFDLFVGKRPYFLTSTWWNDLFTNAQWLLNDHPHLRLNTANLFPNNKMLFFAQLTYTLSMLGVAIFVCKIIRDGRVRLDLPRKPGMTFQEVVIAASLFVPFVCFHTLIMQQKMGLGYYAALYSLIYYIALTFFFQWIRQRSEGRFFTVLFPILILVSVVHGLLFCTYRVDLFDENKWEGRYIYTYEQIFTGQMAPYFKSFTISDGIQKSECRFQYVAAQWAQRKGKRLVIPQQKIDHCNEILGQDRTFPYESRYLRLEQ